MLSAWLTLHGWPAAIEALLRGGQTPDCAAEVSLVALVANESLYKCLGENMDDKVLFERCSLAATVRKLLKSYMQRRACPAESEVLEQHALQESQWKALNDTPLMHSLWSALLNNLEGLDHWLTHMWNGHSGGLKYKLDMLGQGDFDMIEMGTLDNVPVKLFPPIRVHQLQAITALTLVQLCLSRLDWGRRAAIAAPGEEIIKDWLETARSYMSSCNNVRLRETMLASLAGSCSATNFSLLWERYAAAHLNGRLLPGCCNLGCTNLGGVSEETLKTLLCSRCRGARYCGEECQKAAWVNGHSAVCVEALH